MITDAVAIFFQEHDEVLARSQYRDDIAKAHEILKALFKIAGIRATKEIKRIHASRTQGTHLDSADALLFARLLMMGIDQEATSYKTILDCMTSKELAMVHWCTTQLEVWIRHTSGLGADRVATKYAQIGEEARLSFHEKHGYYPEHSPLPEQPLSLSEARSYLKRLGKDIGQPSLFDTTLGDDDDN